MPGPPTALSLLTAWRLSPVGAALALLIGLGYVILLRRQARVRRDAAAGTGAPAWPAGRVACCALAVAGIVYLTCGWVGVYARVLLWVFALQVSLLLVVAPAVLAFARPLSLWGAGSPVAGARIRAGLASPAGRIAASPATGPFVVPVVLGVVFFTGVLPWALGREWADGVLAVVLVLIGSVIALPLAGDDEQATGLAIAAGIFLGLVGLLLDAVPGIVLRLSTRLVAPGTVAARHAPWALPLLADQQRAGAVLWFLGEVLDLPFLALLVLRWIRADTAEAAATDAALDAVAPAAVSETGVELDLPWWETDPSRLGARRSEQLRRRAGRD